MCRYAVVQLKLFLKAIRLYIKIYESRGDLEGLETCPYLIEIDYAKDEIAQDVMTKNEMAETENFESEMAGEIDHTEILPFLKANKQEWLLSYRSLFPDEHQLRMIRINESYKSITSQSLIHIDNIY
jgi:hypothetical protein